MGARCCAQRIYQLVPLEQRPTGDEVRAISHETSSIDLRCSRCGASQTYKLAPDSVLTRIFDSDAGQPDETRAFSGEGSLARPVLARLELRPSAGSDETQQRLAVRRTPRAA